MNTEQEKFDAWLVSLSRPTDKYVMSLWWGSAATMPTYRDSWTEAQWKGWQARAELVPNQSNAQKMRDAGFMARNTKMTCEECGKTFTRQMAPLHKCKL